MGVNDIQEKDRPVTITNMQQLPLGPALNNMRNKTYKQLSFTMDFDTYLKGCMSVVFQKVCLGRRLQIPQICKYSDSCFQIRTPRRVDLIFVL